VSRHLDAQFQLALYSGKEVLEMKLKEIMTRDVHSVSPDDTMTKAARLMRKHDVGVLPVLNNDGEIVGAVTDRDITVRAVANGQDPIATRVRSVMSRNVKTCHTDQTVEDAANCMRNKQIRRLFIVDGDKSELAGVVALGDLVKVNVDKGLVHATLRDISAC
jgi:CBS domain-containing protein